MILSVIVTLIIVLTEGNTENFQNPYGYKFIQMHSNFVNKRLINQEGINQKYKNSHIHNELNRREV